MKNSIHEIGWNVLLVQSTEYLPAFAYTLGLWKNFNHPELISFGLGLKTLQSILNTAANLVKHGQSIEIGRIYDDFFENGDVMFINVDSRNIIDYFGYAIEYQSENFSALQLVWTDRNNQFPWNDDFDKEFEYSQPLLDRNAEFKFREKKNLGIFTTRQWLDLNKPILHVVHDYDGDWQFLTTDQLPEDIRVVSLDQIIQRDNSLNEVFNLDYGEQAVRESLGLKWHRSILEKGN